MMRRRASASVAAGDLDALLAESSLPAEHRALIARLVGEARLPRDDRLDVAEELLCHFEDGLARDVGPHALVTSFGPLDQVAELIRRGRERRRRARMWRRSGLLAATALVTSSTAVYLSSAIALHAADPLVATPRAAASSATAPAWVREATAASAARDRARARLREARAATRGAAIVANLDDAAALRREHLLEADLAAIDIIREAADARTGGETDHAVAAALERALAPDGALLRASVVRAAYADLLDRVYSGQERDARVTAKGLRVLQALGGKTDPGLAAVLLEPVYFAAPARRWELDREIEALMVDFTGAMHPAPNDAVARLRSRQATLDDDAIHAIRFFPITMTLPRLMDAVDRARAASRAIEAIRAAPARVPTPEALTPPGDPRPDRPTKPGTPERSSTGHPPPAAAVTPR